jgi:selenocysteine-specific elongation factor
VHVIATAGHVDHGKSTLVRALTGMEPDRWAEERRRGMTIDLGYAWTTLPAGEEVAFVDVPGHQRFITNMLAGIGPVPAVLLVVAADEGWSRQTAEHLAALEALNVRHGVLAVTRSDLGDADLAIAEARDFLAGTSLEGIEAVAVSPVAGTGLDELRGALERMVATLPAPEANATRLWVDRVFTIHGAGTVLTGTLGSGAIAVGDQLLVASTGEVVHVRGLESLKKQVEATSAVARVAVNLRGAKHANIQRGDALIGAGQWANVTTMDVRLVKAAAKLPARPIMHVGAAAVAVRLRSLGADTARLRWDIPLPLHVGERAILRDPGPQHVVAGAIVLDVDPPSLRRRGAAAARAELLDQVSGVPDPAGEISRRGAVRRRDLVAAGVIADDRTETGGLIVGDWLVDERRWANWQRDLEALVDRWARSHPLQPGIPAAAAVQSLGLPDETLLEPLVRATGALTSDAQGLHRPGATSAVPAEIRQALDRLIEALERDPYAAPTADELADAGLTKAYLAIAVNNGELERVDASIYLRPAAVVSAIEALAALPQPFTLSEARQTLGTTRRVAVPLLELLDRRRLTQRMDSQLRQIRR